MTFTYHGHRLEYFDHPYNTTALNERSVELPIAFRFVDQAAGDGLELGNVMNHYRPGGHRVVDRYEDGADNLDVFELDQQFDWIVAISTLEHVRWDEEPKDPDGAANALRHLLGLLRPGGRMLVTVPFGWHPYLDAEILDHRFAPARQCTLVREHCGRGWRQTPGVEHHRYAATTMWAESVWIAEF